MARRGGGKREAIWLSMAYILIFLSTGTWTGFSAAPQVRGNESAATQGFVGTTKCTTCHATQAIAWQSSQHAVAMQHATEASVLGRFDGATFEKDGIESRFFKRDGKFFVTTDGPDGALADFEILYTFGVYPLQQYLISLPGGRLQALGIAWDARQKSEGGQRWFHLYPNEKLAAGDPLHWTGREQNWNHQCAACHSTNLEKNYDAASNTFATTWSEVSVGCEACHGAGAKHIAWAKSGGDGDPMKGFAKRFNERTGASWVMHGNGQALRSAPRTTSTEIEACAACHSRREQFGQANGALFDAFLPSLLDAGLYWADGQQRDEVFTHGSFLQSRMHAAGVTCSDCHNPHSGKLRRTGNELCAQCHAPARFDLESHHHHKPGSKGSECVGCHMPATVYMGVDARRDHSFRIPRPDLTQSLGVPNACQGCHETKSAASLAESIATWFPVPNSGFQSFADAFDRADRGAPGARAALLEIVKTPSQPSIVRASAIRRLDVNPSSAETFQQALLDPAPEVRFASLQAFANAEPTLKLKLLQPLLRDPARAVRMEAARALAGPSEAMLDAETREHFEAALAEYIAAEKINADRPEHQLNLASLWLSRGKTDAAEAALRQALKVEPSFPPAYVLLAELIRAKANEGDAERTLRDGLKLAPRSGDLHHALGLSLARQKRMAEALEELLHAARTPPLVARYAYTAAVALHDSTRRADAITLLDEALSTHPYDRDLLSLSAAYKLELDDAAGALVHVQLLSDLEPDDRSLAELTAKVEQAAKDVTSPRQPVR